DIHVGGWVHEVDGVGNAIANGPFERIHIVPQCTHQLQRILHNTLAEFGAQVLVFNVIFAFVRVVFDRQHFLLPQADAADVLLPLDELLNDDGAQAKAIVILEHFLQGVTNENILPTASKGIFQHTGKTNVVNNTLPVEGVDQVAQAFSVDDTGDIFF